MAASPVDMVATAVTTEKLRHLLVLCSSLCDDSRDGGPHVDENALAL